MIKTSPVEFLAYKVEVISGQVLAKSAWYHQKRSYFYFRDSSGGTWHEHGLHQWKPTLLEAYISAVEFNVFGLRERVNSREYRESFKNIELLLSSYQHITNVVSLRENA